MPAAPRPQLWQPNVSLDIAKCPLDGTKSPPLWTTGLSNLAQDHIAGKQKIWALKPSRRNHQSKLWTLYPMLPHAPCCDVSRERKEPAERPILSLKDSGTKWGMSQFQLVGIMITGKRSQRSLLGSENENTPFVLHEYIILLPDRTFLIPLYFRRLN